ncbi:uncharacterized protein MELLADRAFT_49983 [Melampsora larici-populina 98AG31]|uniref:LIM zinc-binding domain-containing protein n=1 Tax=Melampsora larici-populina (strain 98AG31 / pathotype 3-4-7) TaxID=747676 RepID=F4S0M3_MELLP|nr:uncharacterized protein MELLADRAFT_49983 [Melampsora larici-populina 98AG31]EGG01842.1 hypothetical protein MELLADRAFT_49983 [Melampsora larici-populina 98AG31]
MPDGARYTFRPSPRVMLTSTAPKCPTCDRSVYAAEQVMGPGGAPYHKPCLKCTSCGRTLDAVNLFEHDHVPYCKMCHSKAFGTKGVGYGNAVVGEYEMIPGRTLSPAPTSPRSPPSYQVAKPSAISSPSSHHSPASFSLDPDRSANFSSPPSDAFNRLSLHGNSQHVSVGKGLQKDKRLIKDDDFDAPMYSPSLRPQTTTRDISPPRPNNDHILGSEIDPTAKGHQPILKQVAETDDQDQSDSSDFEPPAIPFPHIIVKSAGSLSRNSSVGTPARPEPTEHQRFKQDRPISSQTLQRSASTTLVSPPNLPPRTSARLLDQSGPPPPTPPKTSSVKSSHQLTSNFIGRSVSMRNPTSSSPSPSKWSIKTASPPATGSPLVLNLSSQDGPKVCPRCSGTVYHAEQVLALGKKWHKRCLRCCKCSKALDATMCERDGTPYCSRCYDQAFGIESQGFVVRPGFVGR